MADAAGPGDDIAVPVDAGRTELLQVFVRHGVKFVVIGGAAIQSHGRRYVTEDIDLTPDTEAGNLQRLADALNELDCRLVIDPASPGSLGNAASRLLHAAIAACGFGLEPRTRHGLLDLSFTPTGFPGGYADLAPAATTMPAAGTSISVLVASLDDVHASKRAADRPKDRAYFAASEAS